jgi:hypothetical protein
MSREFDRASDLAQRMTDADRAAGRPAPAFGYSAENWDRARREAYGLPRPRRRGQPMSQHHLAPALRYLPLFALRPATVSPVHPVNFAFYPIIWNLRPVWLSAAMVQACGVWYLVNDNGGEIMVDRLNSGEVPKDVPMGPNAATTAARVAMVLRGETIDIALRLEDEDLEIGP